jgi:hypothetical protein
MPVDSSEYQDLLSLITISHAPVKKEFRLRAYRSFKRGNRGSRFFTGVDAVCPENGPYEAPEGIYPGCGQGKN